MKTQIRNIFNRVVSNHTDHAITCEIYFVSQLHVGANLEINDNQTKTIVIFIGFYKLRKQR